MISKNEDEFILSVACKVPNLNTIHIFDPIANIKKGVFWGSDKSDPNKKLRENLTK
jgi:hypothetical protein